MKVACFGCFVGLEPGQGWDWACLGGGINTNIDVKVYVNACV
jgi:hypothetical protein